MLRQSETTSTERKLKDLIMSKLMSKEGAQNCLKELPNFTCQADFALNRTAQRIYRQN